MVTYRMNEWMKTFFKTQQKYQYDNNKKKEMQHTIMQLCKTFYLLVLMFPVWDSDAENHLSMLLLKLSGDFVVRSASGKSFHREALLYLKLCFR